MNNNYWSDCLYPLFLSSLSSCTYLSITDSELQEELDHLALRAIARFKFPKVGLDFIYDETIEDMTLPVVERKAKGYYFVNAVTYKELNVILAWMKVYWLEYQLSKEQLYENNYTDKDVTAFSPGSLLSSIQKAYDTFKATARREEEDYSRVSTNGTPAIGDINVDL